MIFSALLAGCGFTSTRAIVQGGRVVGYEEREVGFASSRHVRTEPSYFARCLAEYEEYSAEAGLDAREHCLILAVEKKRREQRMLDNAAKPGWEVEREYLYPHNNQTPEPHAVGASEKEGK